ncbi:MAG TPA: dephospho-CoA kinase, partial [Myxococcales bacterium]|nr:dephospho-CoA kinase [Myxococcales bacterium]
MRVFGLTGNIGTGKSTVASLFGEKGVPVIDADQVARDVVAKGTEGLRQVEARFPGVVAPDGTLDRKALAARVFADAQERLALNAILHPRIGLEVKNRLDRLAAQGQDIALYEAALIVENGLEHGLGGLIVVTAPIGEQLK